MTSGTSTVVEHLPRHSKVMGSCPFATVGNERENIKYSHDFNGIVCFKNELNHLDININSYLETFGGQSSNLYLNVIHFFNASVNWTSVAA